MKICILANTLNDKTGAGEFAVNLSKWATDILPQAVFSFMTGDDLLSPGYFKLLKNWPKIVCKIREADVIHALDGYPYGVIAMLANLFINKPLIITAVGTGSIQKLKGFGLKSVLLRLAFVRADRITAISQFVAQKVREEVKRVAITVINHGVDYEYWSMISATRVDNQLATLIPYILSVGELKRRKGYDRMLPIIGRILEKAPNIHYVIVANTDKNMNYYSELCSQIEHLGLDGRVHFLSQLSREELRNVFQKAELYFTLPQNIGGDVEGFGLSILQAAAAGLPAVVGRGSGASDAVADNESGFLVAGEDVKEILTKVERLLTNRIERDRMSKNARDFSRRMSWKIKVCDYADTYKELNKLK